MALNERQQQLLDDLRAIQAHLGAGTRERHGRMNPFTEDLVSWEARGAAWAGEGSGVTIYGSSTLAGDVRLGRGVWVGPFCSLDGSGGLEIGAHTTLAAGVQVVTHDTVRRALSGGAHPPERAPVAIGESCFLGSLAVVTKGVTVGDRCVIAAGAVVTRDVPPQTIVGGIPARPIGRVVVEGDRIGLRYD